MAPKASIKDVSDRVDLLASDAKARGKPVPSTRTKLQRDVPALLRRGIIEATEVAGRVYGKKGGQRRPWIRGQDHLVNYLAVQAVEHPRDYLRMLTQMLPKEVDLKADINTTTALYAEITGSALRLRDERDGSPVVAPRMIDATPVIEDDLDFLEM